VSGQIVTASSAVKSRYDPDRFFRCRPSTIMQALARPTGFERAGAINIRIPIEGADIGLMAEGA
jgi:hypothetical protein